MADLKQLRSQYDQQVGERDRIQLGLDRVRERIKRGERHLSRVRKAQEVVRAVALRTQQQLEYHIASVVSNAQQAVFDDPYGLEVSFEQRRGRTECDLWFTRGDQQVPPMSAGLGAVDIAAFALRVSSWSLSQQPTRNVLLLDEPFKHLKGTAQNRRAIRLLHQVSQELGLQIITISDERAPREDITSGADRTIEVSKVEGRSRLRVVNDGPDGE